MKLLIILFFSMAGFSNLVTIRDNLENWEIFKVTHNRVYGSVQEEQLRRSIFMKNLKFVRHHNKKYLSGKVSFDVEINRFADMTSQEFVSTMNGIKLSNDIKCSGEVFTRPKDFLVPPTVDWRKEGAVTPVKDQGRCSSCYTFSAAGSLEGQHYRKTGNLVSLSEQNILDCSRKEGNYGCEGGLMNQVFKYVQDNDGIDTESSYPYEARDGDCRYKAKHKGATDHGFVNIPSGSEEDLLQAVVAFHGPISAAVDSSYPSFQFYKSGVYSEYDCSDDDVDRAVLVVGYGNLTKGGPYWLVKNSWGTQWGMQGYILMARTGWNMCGIAAMASFPKS